MKKIYLQFFLLIAMLPLFAQKVPKAVVKHKNAVAKVHTFNNGKLLKSGLGVFVGNDGDFFSSYSLFLDADSAVTIDTNGKVRQIEKLLGANEMYDCIKASVISDGKISGVSISDAKAKPSNVLYIISYGMKKDGEIYSAPVKEVTDIVDANSYYTLSFEAKEVLISAPVLNETGQLVALMQPIEENDTMVSYAVAATLIRNLKINAVNYHSDRFSRISISRKLPDTHDEALSCLYMQSLINDSTAYVKMLNEFIALFPNSSQGYLNRAQFYAPDTVQRSKTEADWNDALKVSDKPHEVYYHKAKTIYSLLASTDSLSPEWNLKNCISLIDKAIELDSQPLYKQLKANMLFSDKQIQQTADLLTSLTSTNLVSADMYTTIARCKELLGDVDGALVYMDSAIYTFGTTPIAAMSPYILQRGLIKDRAAMYRDAIKDYNIYTNLLNRNVNANFYYLRYRAEYKAKLYEIALNDIETAIKMEPENVNFLVEKGMICYRVNLFDDASVALTKAISLAPNYPDGYYILALCLLEKGEKAKAIENLRKAAELGHGEAEKKLKELN